jgi:hypothetical protein
MPRTNDLQLQIGKNPSGEELREDISQLKLKINFHKLVHGTGMPHNNDPRWPKFDKSLK